jgi:hypothetical protein
LTHYTAAKAGVVVIGKVGAEVVQAARAAAVFVVAAVVTLHQAQAAQPKVDGSRMPAVLVVVGSTTSKCAQLKARNARNVDA